MTRVSVTHTGDSFLARGRDGRCPGGVGTPVNQERVQKLRSYGLTEYQARVYLALLDLGTSEASAVPAASRVPRTRVYATMRQLHDKGLVQILPEKPLRYKAVPLAAYLKSLAEDYREKAFQLSSTATNVARDFPIGAIASREPRGRFEAIYGRRNVRDKLVEMYRGAQSEIIGIGSLHSPARIIHGLGIDLEEKVAAGVTVKLAFFLEPSNAADVRQLSRHADVRQIDFFTPVCRHGVDGRQFLMSHPIPDDDSPVRGEDIAIWTDDPAIAEAMSQMTERIWEMGKRVSSPLRRKVPDRRRRDLTPMAES